MTCAVTRAAALLATVVVCAAGCVPVTGRGTSGPDARPTARPTAGVSTGANPPGPTPTPEPPQARSLRGTQAWRLRNPATDRQIEGYAQLRGPRGRARLRLMVSTTARRFRVYLYRIGGYRGGSGRLFWSSTSIRGHLQPEPTLLSQTRTVVAGWSRSLSVSTAGWPPGFYVAKLVASSGYEAHVPVILPSASTAGRVVLVAPTMTWQAYNIWGGYDLYHAPLGGYRSWAVSFDRPYDAPGSGQFIYSVVGTAVLAERLGIPVAYATDVDVATEPRLLEGATGYVSLGHDEYWTVPERRAVERARDRGTNLLFMSSNASYWRVRLERSETGPLPLVVGYKGDASGSDPFRLTHPERTTARWRDSPSPDPENSLTGMLYECYPVDAPYHVASPRWWGFRGTHVHDGTEFEHLVGVEGDRVYPVSSTPRPLQVLSYVSYSCGGVPTSAQSTYYTAPSGAGVIDFGTQRWSCAVKTSCSPLDPEVDVFVRQVTSNVLRAFAAGPVGRRHPAHDNLDEFYLPDYNVVPAS